MTTRGNETAKADSNETQDQHTGDAGNSIPSQVTQQMREDAQKELFSLLEDFVSFGGAEMVIKDLTNVHVGWLQDKAEQQPDLTKEGWNDLASTSWGIMRAIQFVAKLDNDWKRFKEFHPSVKC